MNNLRECMLAALMAGPVAGMAGEKPNVVFIMMDDLGFSQISPNINRLSVNRYDPLFVAYTDKIRDFPLDEAVEAAKTATPTLGSMADSGILFSHAFASSNLCAPSRVGIATGVFQNRFGMHQNSDVDASCRNDLHLLAKDIKALGYQTGHFGKWHLAGNDPEMPGQALKQFGIEGELTIREIQEKHPHVHRWLIQNGFTGSVCPAMHPLNNGFDRYFGYNMWESPFYNATNVWNNREHAGKVEQYNTEVFTREAMKFMQESIDAGTPFYVQLHYHAVHIPLDPKAPEQYLGRFHTRSENLNNFYAHIFAVDESVRIMAEYLKERDVYENTLFIFTSDNGGAIGDLSFFPGNAPYTGHKGMIVQGGLRVPLIMHWPAGIQKHGIYGHPVSLMDILPTVLDAAGGKVPEGLDGRPLTPVLKGDLDYRPHEYLIFAGIHSMCWGFNMYRSKMDRHIFRNFDPGAWAILKEPYFLRFIGKTPPGIYEDAMDGLPEHIHLFHYLDDPQEIRDLKEEKPEIFRELHDLYMDEAKFFPPPIKWEREKWESFVPAGNKYLNERN